MRQRLQAGSAEGEKAWLLALIAASEEVFGPASRPWRSDSAIRVSLEAQLGAPAYPYGSSAFSLRN